MTADPADDLPPSHPAPAATATPRRRWRTAIARWALAALVGLSLALAIDLIRQNAAKDRVAWTSLQSLDQLAVAEAPTPAPAASSTPPYRLIRYTADHCGPCRMMVTDVFSRPELADLIEQATVPLSVDLTRPAADTIALARRHRIVSTPTLILTDADGRELSRLERAVDAQAFRAWFDLHTRGANS